MEIELYFGGFVVWVLVDVLQDGVCNEAAVVVVADVGAVAVGGGAGMDIVVGNAVGTPEQWKHAGVDA